MASDKTESGDKPGFFSRLFGRRETPSEAPQQTEAAAPAEVEPGANAEAEAQADAETIHETRADEAAEVVEAETAAPVPSEETVSEAMVDAIAAASASGFSIPAGVVTPLEAPPVAPGDGTALPDEPTASAADPPAAEPAPVETAMPKRSWWTRLKEGLARSSSSLGSGITDIFTKRKLDDAMLEELEDVLIRSDLGVATATRISAAVGKGRYDRQVSPDDVKAILASEVEKVLAPHAVPISLEAGPKPFVILVVGVNGSGKTTTIGKLAAKFSGEGKTVMLAAGDTFRAAAIAQLRIWGERLGCAVIAREQGSDAAGLAFDAVTEARAHGTDVLLMDTAGRLQNRAELMAELEKIIRVMRKVDASAPHAVLLVLDATVGQNAMNQVEIFGKVAGVTGLVMTKLDGTARGGILVAIAETFKLPIHFIGVGETAEDLEPFSARDFAEAIAGIERKV